MSDTTYPFYVFDIFDRLRNDKMYFCHCIQKQLRSHHEFLRIDVESSDRRLFEAHEFWVEDIKRIEEFEDLTHGAEELKLAALLAYWIRRTSPIIIMTSPKTEFKMHEELKEIHLKYANEYSAFTIGFDLCAYFTAGKKGSDVFKNDFQLDETYILTMCHFLKTKNVSPHALFLIFKSLLFNPLKTQAHKYQSA